MTKQIDPGEGYRLLEPGEVIRDGDDFWNSCGSCWKPAECDIGLTQGFSMHRRRIEQTSPWIAVSEKPLPKSGIGWVTHADGQQSLMPLKFELLQTDSIIAYLPVERPEPYVPPKPKRDHRWIKDGDREREYIEKLDDDVAPDAAIRARDYAAKHSTMGSEDYQIAMRTVHRILTEEVTP